MIFTCISQELESPDELKDVEHSKDSRVSKVPEIRVGNSSGGISEVLEHEECDKSCHEEDEERNIGIDHNPVEKESFGIFKENSLKFYFVGIEKEHAEAKDGEKEADNSDCDLPSWVMAVKTSLLNYYAELATRMITPSAIRQTAAAMGAIFGTNLGTM